MAYKDVNRAREHSRVAQVKRRGTEEGRAKEAEYRLKNKEQIRFRAKRNYLLVKHKMTIDQLEMMKIQQNDKCGICSTQFNYTSTRVGNCCCIDHDHSTEQVRGLLCGNCNRGIGIFKDSIEFLEKAINYLKQFHPNVSLNASELHHNQHSLPPVPTFFQLHDIFQPLSSPQGLAVYEDQLQHLC
jgi:hypothetical protein